MVDPDPDLGADQAPAPPPLTTARLLLRGMRKRCALCGAGDQFESWFRKRDRCPRCNFPLERIEGNWIGALGMNTVATFAAIGITMAVGFTITYPDIPLVPMLVACLAVAVLFPLWFMPISHTLWSAIDLRLRPPDPSDDLDPRWLPASRPTAGGRGR